jgi:isopentenyl phosphate kinase
MEGLKPGSLKPPLVLKLGGSVVTFKDRIETPNIQAIRRLSREIAEAKHPSLLIVHGGGSFGHPYAQAYKLTEGYKGGRTQLAGFTRTREAMLKLNSIIVKALNLAGVPAVGLQTSALAVTRAGRISSLNLEPILGVLRLGGVPVLYGDAVLDLKQGFTILSGDRLSTALALRLGSRRLIMGADVDGVYTSDPKVDPNSKLIRELNVHGKEFRAVLSGIKGSRAMDVTGGMKQKILEVKPFVSKGGTVLIVNALKPGSVGKALQGLKTRGTLIRA